MPRTLMHHFALGTCFVLLCTALACGDASTRPTDVEQLPRDGAAYFPPATSAWRSADPNAVGLQASRLNALSEAIAGGGHAGVNSRIIVRHGSLVTERHFNGTSATTSQTVQSVTKSVASLLAGIAIDKSHLTANARVLRGYGV